MDLVPTTADDGTLSFRPVLGGSFFNIALGLGRLGAPAAYMWELSEDTFARMFRSALTEAGVSLELVAASRRSTPVSVVDLSGEEPRYNIADPDAVMRKFRPPLPEAWPHEARILVTGSAILALEPAGREVEAMIAQRPEHVMLALDYNVRPPAVTDLAAYRARLERLTREAALVKASHADLSFLYGEDTPSGHLERLRSAGVQLAIITLGADGLVALAGDTLIEMGAEPTEVVDPVGAGDGFTAGLLSALAARNAWTRENLGRLSEPDLRAVLAEAQCVAASVCRNLGADMPWREDLA